MAEAVVLDTWAGTDVRLSRVVDRLIELRRKKARTAARTCVMTLIVVAADDDEALRAQQTMHALGGHHPTRLITLRPEPETSTSGVDATVTICGALESDHPIAFDEVGLLVRGEAANHLKSVVEPFTLPDLPIVVWYPGTLPTKGEPLLSIADTLLVDSKETGEEHAFAALADLIHDRVVVDLSWERLRPWRLLLAALFDGRAYRPLSAAITGIEVAGKPGPRQLLAGWLMSRLGAPRSRVHLTDDRHIQVVLHAEGDGRTATFELSRGAGERVVRARATIDGGPQLSEVLALPDDSLAWSLAQALTHLDRDRVWEAALTAAVVLSTAST